MELLSLIVPGDFDHETGVVMLIYLDHAVEEVRARCAAEGRPYTRNNLYEAIMVGAVERVRAEQQLRRPIGDDHEHAQLLAVAAEVGEQVHRREVRPVNVIEEQHNRAEARRLLKEVAEFAQHGGQEVRLAGAGRAAEEQGALARGAGHELVDEPPRA